VALAALGGAVALSGTAHAAPTQVSASTHLSNVPDSGNGGNNWSYDDYTRTLTVKVDPSQTGAPGGDTQYLASISDNGQFNAIVGQLSPNQAVAGTQILHAVTGSMKGSGTYVVEAPSTDALDVNNIPRTVNDNFADGTGNETTGNWPVQAFTTATGVTASLDNDWTWTYTDQCESWTDAATNGDGGLAADGNITGKNCKVTPPKPPVKPQPKVKVYDLRAYGEGWGNREVITWDQTAKAGDTVKVSGQGSFNVRPGTGRVVLSGLHRGKTYQVSVTPDVRNGTGETISFRA
jgi:hypothetical protein